MGGRIADFGGVIGEIGWLRVRGPARLLIVLVPQELLERSDYEPVTRSRLADALSQMGVCSGGVVMAHVRLSALGWVVGGMDSVVLALRDVVGERGTLMAFTGWEDSPYHVMGWPRRWQDAYRDQPPFDPAVSAARREFGRWPERLRTWPGAIRSRHPEVSFCAWGPAATQILEDPTEDPWGAAGPLGRLVAADGQVVMIGAPLRSLTLCHHAEAIANVDCRRFHEYDCPVRRDDGSVDWVHYRTMDTFYGSLPYWDRDDLNVQSPVDTLSRQAVAAGATTESRIDDCPLVLVDAPAAVAAVVAWIERTF